MPEICIFLEVKSKCSTRKSDKTVKKIIIDFTLTPYAIDQTLYTILFFFIFYDPF